MKRLVALALAVVPFVATAQPFVVPWSAQTTPIPSTRAGDVAFVHRDLTLDDGGTERLIALVGTDTAQVGAYAWSVGGTLGQVLPLGPLSGVHGVDDLLLIGNLNFGLQGFTLGDAGLEQLTPTSFPSISPGPITFAPRDGGFVVYVDTHSTNLRKVGLTRDGGQLVFSAEGQLPLPQPASGLTIDPRTQQLYVAQPSLGVLRIDPDGTSTFVGSIDGGQLGAVVGGLELMPLVDGGAWLFSAVASSDQVAIHALHPLDGMVFVGAFSVGSPDGGAARARQPAHLALMLLPFGTEKRGLLALHDDLNANYKIVSLDALNDVISLPLTSPDAGVATPDAGTDAGVIDAGHSGTGGGSPGGGFVPPPGVDPPPSGCSCGMPSFLILPVLLLWWIRRPRS